MSIDNIICEWQYSGSEKALRKAVLGAFETLIEDFDPLHDVNLDRPTAGKYSWFRNSAWGDGVLVRWDKFRTLSKAVETRPIVQLEVNPNKHWKAPVLHAILDILRSVGNNGTLRKYDLAVDVPVRIEHVQVESRKKRADVRGTLYFGSRNKHGHLRVYDKASELSGRGSAVDVPELTRLEWTFVDGEPVTFDQVGLRFFDSFHSGYGTLSQNARMVADLTAMLMEKGVEWNEIRPFLNRCTREKVEPAVSGAYVRLCVSTETVYALIDRYCDALMVSYRDENCNWVARGSNRPELRMALPGV